MQTFLEHISEQPSPVEGVWTYPEFFIQSRSDVLIWGERTPRGARERGRLELEGFHGAVQLSRSLRIESSGLRRLLRRAPRSAHWVHLRIRVPGGGDLKLSARVAEPELLADVPEMNVVGQEVPLEVFRGVVETAISMGASRPRPVHVEGALSWTPVGQVQARRVERALLKSGDWAEVVAFLDGVQPEAVASLHATFQEQLELPARERKAPAHWLMRALTYDEPLMRFAMSIDLALLPRHERRGLEDLDFLHRFPWIQYLFASRTGVASLAPLAQHEQLQELNVAHTRIESLEPLSDAQGLSTLSIAHTVVESLAPLAGQARLSLLYASHTRVSDLLPLARLSNLERLYLAHTGVEDLSPVLNLPKLKVLDVRGCPLDARTRSRLKKSEGMRTYELQYDPE